MKKDQGIVLLAFGKRGYAYAAYNMAVSIRQFNKDINVTLFVERTIRKYIKEDLFTEVIELEDYEIYEPGIGMDPGKVKTCIYDRLPYKENLYLDVDGCVLKDIQPLMNYLAGLDGYYFTEVRSLNKKNEMGDYHIWAKSEDLWPFYGLEEEAVYPAVQSSFAFIRKNTEAKKFFAQIKKNYALKFPKNKLTMRWGGTIPDELLFSVTCAQFGINPDAGIQPIFFGAEPNFQEYGLNFSRIKEEYYITSIYGNGNGRRSLTHKDYITWYDSLLKKYAIAQDVVVFPGKEIMNDKHVNNTTL